MRNDQKVIKSITIKVTEEEHTFVERQGNKSKYIRKLIQKEMNPVIDLDMITKLVKDIIASNGATITRDSVENIMARESVKSMQKEANKATDVLAAIDDMFDLGD